MNNFEYEVKVASADDKDFIKRILDMGLNINRLRPPYVSFKGANLESANLYSAKLQGANLQNAKLMNADLRWSKLIDANLVDANLENVKLQGANLEGANLKGTNLKGATLFYVNLEGAKLNWYSHNLIGELLRQHADTPTQYAIAGYVSFAIHLCWDEIIDLAPFTKNEIDWAVNILWQHAIDSNDTDITIFDDMRGDIMLRSIFERNNDELK